MSRYTHETPMDFEFQNGTGPMDGRSPFAQVSVNSQRRPTSSNSPTKKRTYSAFDSPAKARPVGGRPNSPEKPLPRVPAAYNTLFSTPRKPKNDIEDSSAGETPLSAEPKTDSDATPEMKSRNKALVTLDRDMLATLPAAKQERGSPTKERPMFERNDSSLRYWATKIKKACSPGRGEVLRGAHSGAIAKNVAKRRKRGLDQQIARGRRLSGSDSVDDYDQGSGSPRKSGRDGDDNGEPKPYWLSSLFTFVDQHPTLPNTLSQYAQFVFNVTLLLVFVYAIYCFWSTVMSDVDKMANEARADAMALAMQCTKDYKANNCDTPLPRLVGDCSEWRKCMNQDSTIVARATISARTFATIFNNFVEPISYKAMIFTCIIVFGGFTICNLAFGLFRQKMLPDYGYPVPPTPHRTFSGQEGNFYAGTPWHQPPIGATFEPQPSGGFGQIDGRQSPQRRLVYN